VIEDKARGQAGKREDDPSAPAVGANLRRLRSRRGLSLERLARRAGVSRAMLSQIELGRSAPTINSLWKVARALDVTFAALVARRNDSTPVVLPASEGKLLTNHEGTFTSRALFPLGERRRAEFYELRVKPGGEETAAPHPPGTVENLVVAAGAVDIDIAGTEHRLETGDAILFNADVLHAYRNTGVSEVVMYLVMTHGSDVG
jgi:transcriptional regulator with XRE-family HTH domain